MGVLPDWMIERDIGIHPFSEAQHRPGVVSYGVTSYGYDVRVGYKWKVFDVISGGIVDPKDFDPKLLRDIDLTPPQTHDFNEASSDPSCRRCHVYKSNPYAEHWLAACKLKAVPDHIIIPPNSYALGESLETFKIPRDVVCICVGKSTYARCGIIINVTPGEPEWEGKWTIEISNSTPLPAKVYCGEGIMQCLFLRSDGYAERTAGVTEHLCQTLLKQNAKAVEPADCRQSYKDKKGKYQGQSGLTLPVVKKD